VGNLKVVQLYGTQKSPTDGNVLQTGLARLCKMHYTGFCGGEILAEQVKNTHFALKKTPVFTACHPVQYRQRKGQRPR
jgi:hypothetical protein